MPHKHSYHSHYTQLLIILHQLNSTHSVYPRAHAIDSECHTRFPHSVHIRSYVYISSRGAKPSSSLSSQRPSTSSLEIKQYQQVIQPSAPSTLSLTSYNSWYITQPPLQTMTHSHPHGLLLFVCLTPTGLFGFPKYSLRSAYQHVHTLWSTTVLAGIIVMFLMMGLISPTIS